MKNIEANLKICPFISCGFAADTHKLRDGESAIFIYCICEKCMAWENTSFGTNIKEEDKEGFCKRLER